MVWLVTVLRSDFSGATVGADRSIVLITPKSPATLAVMTPEDFPIRLSDLG
jgi:hypothetical protein